MQAFEPTPPVLKPKLRTIKWICLSIFVALQLFPGGLVGLVYAVIARIKLARNKINGAKRTYKVARICTLVSAAIGIVMMIIEKIYDRHHTETFEQLLISLFTF